MQTASWSDPDTSTSITHSDLMKMAAKRSVVLLGENHNSAQQHLWQMHVAAGLLAHRSDIVMGFEMFPARLNPVLTRWSNGELGELEFLDAAEWSTVWGFDPELYMPIFRFCRAFRLPMIGLNCRRGLVSEIGKGGWDSVPENLLENLTPARDASPKYRDYLFQATGGARSDRTAKSAADPAFDRFVRAQQVWDRAFACRIADVVTKPNAPLVIGIIGRGHLDFRGGTPFQLDDLGIANSLILLADETGKNQPAGIADAVFQLNPI